MTVATATRRRQRRISQQTRAFALLVAFYGRLERLYHGPEPILTVAIRHRRKIDRCDFRTGVARLVKDIRRLQREREDA